MARDDPLPDEHRWDAAHKALDHARRLRAEGKTEEAKAICTGLEQLYRDDPSAMEILAKIREQR